MKWPSTQIGAICERTRTRDPRERPDEVFTYVDIASIDRDQKTITQASNIRGSDAPSRARKEIRAGDILVSTVRPSLNAVVIVPPALDGQIASTGFCVLRPDTRLLDGRYLFYFVRTQGFIDTLISKVRGAHYPAVADDDVKSVEIPLPSITEQRRIAEILDQADALRKQRAEADAKAARILPALFYQKFGDPLRNTKGLQMVYLGDPGIAEINPRMLTKDLPDDLEVSFVPMADVDEKWGQITGKQIKKLAEVRKGFTSFREDDVLFAKITPCMENGKAAIARNLCNGLGYGSTEFHVLRSGDLLTPEWIYGLIRLNVFRNAAKGSFTGSVGQQRVPSAFLSGFRVPLPTKEALDKYSSVMRELMGSVHQRQLSESKIERLFQITIHRAFAGELTAKWREAHMKELLQEMEHQVRALA